MLDIQYSDQHQADHYIDIWIVRFLCIAVVFKCVLPFLLLVLAFAKDQYI